MTMSSNRIQGGMALIIALLLLLVLTVLGVAGMSSGLMQERMSGNVNLQALSFEAASAGVARSLEYGLDKDNWDQDSCTRGSGEWYNQNWTDFMPISVPGLPEGTVVEYRQRIGCVEPDPMPVNWQDPDFLIPNQLLVLNQGQVRRVTDGAVLARREVEVRVENRGGDSQCAIRIEGELDNIDIRGGGVSVEGGEGGCPISLSPGGGAEDLIDGIGDQHIGEYQPEPPGITENDGFYPWNEPVAFAELVNKLKYAVLAYQQYVEDLSEFENSPLDSPYNVSNDPDNPVFEWDPVLAGFDEFEGEIEACKSTFFAGSSRIGGTGTIPGGSCRIGPGNTNPSWRYTDATVGDPSDPLHISYIAGHLGNPANNSGGGIVIVEGGNCWSGTADFQGLQLIVGGHFEIIGGGGGDTSGAIVMTKLEDRYGVSDFNYGPPWNTEDLKELPYPDPTLAEFSSSGLVFKGGGNHNIEFQCGGDGESIGLTDYVGRINQCLGTEYLPACDPDGLGTRKAIASWREYIDRQRWPND